MNNKLKKNVNHFFHHSSNEEKRKKENTKLETKEKDMDYSFGLSLDEEVNKLYAITMRNGIIKKGEESEWLAYLKVTLLSHSDLPMLNKLIYQLFILAQHPQKFIQILPNEAEYLDLLMHFSVHGELLKEYLNNPLEDNLKITSR